VEALLEGRLLPLPRPASRPSTSTKIGVAVSVSLAVDWSRARTGLAGRADGHLHGRPLTLADKRLA
jgi:hypothetical protein